MISDILPNVHRLVHNNLKNKLTIIYKDSSTKEIDMTNDEYEEMIMNRNFSKIKEYV